jgi:hypothetical protein
VDQNTLLSSVAAVGIVVAYLLLRSRTATAAAPAVDTPVMQVQALAPQAGPLVRQDLAAMFGSLKSRIDSPCPECADRHRTLVAIASVIERAREQAAKVSP